MQTTAAAQRHAEAGVQGQLPLVYSQGFQEGVVTGIPATTSSADPITLGQGGHPPPNPPVTSLHQLAMLSLPPPLESLLPSALQHPPTDPANPQPPLVPTAFPSPPAPPSPLLRPPISTTFLNPTQPSSAFRRVTHPGDLVANPRVRPPTSQNLVKNLTRNLLAVYHTVNPTFQYQSDNNPRRVLTKPSKPAHNDGYDNEDGDYILYVNDTLGTSEGQQYLILDVLGQGTFGQVVKCMNVKTRDMVAVKVIKNKPAYYNQSLVEVAILEMLNSQYDPNDRHHLVRMMDTFVHRSHLCIVFEMLSVNLYELIKQNGFRGLSTNLVRVFVAQILDALSILNRARIIHCDLKPENILLKNLESPSIKVIDYGSACHENQTVYTYIQSRFYRSPEVLVGLPYTSSIDMWSLGCIAAELFLGLPLFPGSSEYNQVGRIVEMLGVPPAYMIEKGKQAHQYFEKRYGPDGRATYRLKSMETYMRETGCAEQPSKRYFSGTTLEEVVGNYPVTRRGLSQRELEKEMQNRQSFVDFLRGLLNLNPLERWSPQQARAHPFVTGEKYTGPFVPPSRRATALSSAIPGTVEDLSGSHHQRSSQRPRANTISSSTMDRHNVPPQLQRLVELSAGSGSSGSNSSSGSRAGRTRQSAHGGAGAAGGGLDVPALDTPGSMTESSTSGIEVEVVGDMERGPDMMELSGSPGTADREGEGDGIDVGLNDGGQMNRAVSAAASYASAGDPYGLVAIPADEDATETDSDPSESADHMETHDDDSTVENARAPSLGESQGGLGGFRSRLGGGAIVPSVGDVMDASGPGASETRTFEDSGPGGGGYVDQGGGSGWTSGPMGGLVGSGNRGNDVGVMRSAPLYGLAASGATSGGAVPDNFDVPTEDSESASVSHGVMRRTEGFVVPVGGGLEVVDMDADVAVAALPSVPTIQDVEVLKSRQTLAMSTSVTPENILSALPPSHIAASVEPSAPPLPPASTMQLPVTSQPLTAIHLGDAFIFRNAVGNPHVSRQTSISVDESAYVDFSGEDDDGILTPGVASSMGNDSAVSLSPRTSNFDSPNSSRDNSGTRIQQGRRHTLPSVARAQLTDRRGTGAGANGDGLPEPRSGSRRRSMAPSEYGHTGQLQPKRRFGGAS
ncbi:dual specificity protein kinase yak1 [Gonapodya sp. JEL0774]|nr:dual specificity protein kinase yak1 [Gonapodya sp. JEL0774]